MALADFERAADDIRLTIQVTTYALQNFEAVRFHPPERVMEFMSRFDILYAVWLDPYGVKFRKIKGPEKSELTHMINAFPVADESEAREWSARFAGGGAAVFKEAINCGLYVIARDGEIVTP